MEFNHFASEIKEHVQEMYKESNNVVFEVDIPDKDVFWELYQDSFPEGSNPIYRKRREHDCSACRHFIKSFGGVVSIDKDLNIHTIWDVHTGDVVYQTVADAMAEYVKSRPIIWRFYTKERIIGMESSPELLDDGIVMRWNHFYAYIPMEAVHKGRESINEKAGAYRDTAKVFYRSLSEISMDAIDTVLELIRSNTLYKGQEWERPLVEFRKHKEVFDNLDSDELKSRYTWLYADKVGASIGRIRNHSIGVLLTDITNGEDLDKAVSNYERIVAPTNYKRPKAIFTKKMLEDAQNTVTELGYMDSLNRRHAKLDDVRVNNILFCNRNAAKRISGGDVFAEMMADVKSTAKKFDRVEEIGIEKFISDVLPTATEVQAYVENKHIPNFVSLIAPENKDAKSMFKWGNGFSWAYSGNVTDSDVKENVKRAGGNVNGVLRFSIQWNDTSEYSKNDLDAHCVTPTTEIYYSNKSDCNTGFLDVDIINPRSGVPAVENIVWTDKRRMPVGEYRFYVHQFSNRGGRDGFRAEIEFDGQVYSYDYRKELRQGENVAVAVVTLDRYGNFTIKEMLDSTTASKDVWNVKTNEFVPVSTIMYSPNYWDEQKGIGHKHYFFMLEGCENSEQPNGFYNEFIKEELVQHKRVFEALGAKMKVSYVEDQLSGLGFSSTKRSELVVKVKGATERVMKIKF